MQLPPTLTRKQNQYIRRLAHKKYRTCEQAFVVQGVKSVQALLASTYEVEYLVGTPLFWEERPSWLGLDHGQLLTASPDQLVYLGSFQRNDQLLAVVKIPACQVPVWRQGMRVLVLDDIRDPGNLGAILRIADWYGIDHVICSPMTVECYNPKVIQASMGSFAHVPAYYTPLLPLLETATMPVIGMLLSHGRPLHKEVLPQEGLLVIGNESHGINPMLLPHLKVQVTIPCYGQAASLNAAMATAITCHVWVT